MANYNDIQIIIMAGGIGSRFWPMSTPDYPKQFIDVMGVGRSLIKLTNTTLYQRVLNKALSNTSDKEVIVTIGIKPSRPETGYGYIAAAEPTTVDEIYKVEAFKEKTDLKTAEQYLVPRGLQEIRFTFVPRAKKEE